jgi:hypothetical protein
MAFKYECEHSAKTGLKAFHSSGNGKPRARKCKYCGGGFYIESGKWGVFVWGAGTRSYRREDAVKLFEREQTAEDFAYANADKNYCVRWVWESSDYRAAGAKA